MALKIIYNEFADRIELTELSKYAFFNQREEKIKAIWIDNGMLDLGNDLWLNVNQYFIPNYEDVIRRFTKQEDNILIDSISSNDGDKILPVSTILATSIAEFADLTGVTITSYSGDQLLSISGNNIISSGTGFVFDLLLSDGTFIPFLHLKTDVSGNENHILNITDISLGYDINGSSYLQDKGVVERLEDVIVNGDFSDGLTGWNTTSGISVVEDSCRMLSDGSLEYFWQELELLSGENYTVKFDVVKDIIGDGVKIGSDIIDNFFALSINGVGRKVIDFTAIGSKLSFVRQSGIPTDITIDNISVTLATPEIIPNTPTGQAAYPIVPGDTFIAGGGMMNLTDCLVRLYEVGDADIEHTFFDKSNALIWKQTVRDSIYYDASNTGDWHTSELTQQYIYDNIQDAYKYQLWSKVNNLGIFKDIFLYPISLGIEDAVKAGKYVGNPVVIPYEVTEGNYQVTEGDYLVTP